MRHLGIDYGTRRIGLALSDDEGKMGFPHKVIPNTRNLLEVICSLIKDEKVETIVFGESKDLDGTDNPIQKEITLFADQVKEATGIPVVFESEHYTTKQARDTQRLAGKGKDRADAVAAAIILTSYLEKHGNN